MCVVLSHKVSGNFFKARTENQKICLQLNSAPSPPTFPEGFHSILSNCMVARDTEKPSVDNFRIFSRLCSKAI